MRSPESWRAQLAPVRMQRVALVAPAERGRDLLVELARAGTVELDLPGAPAAGEAELDRAAAAAVRDGPFVGYVGWTPSRGLETLAAALGSCGAAVVPVRTPPGKDPPTLLSGDRAGRVLVDTYATVPYRDVDPARIAGPAYALMFGMMFGDVGHGAVLVLAGLMLRAQVWPRLVPIARAWSFVVGAGVMSVVFGALYGEAFGPTGLPVLWLDPLASPVPLLAAAIALGGALLLGAFALGTVNRVREGGWGYALYARTGLAGSLLFVSVGLLVWGLLSVPLLVWVAAALGAVALVLISIGLVAESGRGFSGAVQAGVELVDTVVRLASNLVSFARLAAFGLTHAALTTLVWQGTTALWAPGWRIAAALALLVVGNVVTFALEALVAGVQALRLEYYELFSRVFTAEGRPFRPWAPFEGNPS